MLHISNHGPLITGSNYWESEMAARGLLYMSTNAGAFRLLVPLAQRQIISDMRPGAKHIVVSMLATDQWREREYCAEWLVEDGTSAPWSCHLSPGQVDRAGGRDDVGKQWLATVWDLKSGKPHKCLERPAYFQIVPRLPWLKRIDL